MTKVKGHEGYSNADDEQYESVRNREFNEQADLLAVEGAAQHAADPSLVNACRTRLTLPKDNQKRLLAV